MMQKKLTTAEIDKLYNFAENHGVAYYDLQSELADHLANAIEEQWEYSQNPDFNDALKASFASFGGNGFDEVVAERKKALGKRYEKLMKKYLRQFFTFPHSTVTLALAFGTYKLLEFEPMLYAGLIALVIIANVVIIRTTKKRNEKAAALGEKRWLFKEMIYKFGGIAGFAGIQLQLFIITLPGHKMQVFSLVLLTIVFTVLVLYNYIVVIVIPSKAEEYLRSVYPEYSL